jgi:hypothetical protein
MTKFTTEDTESTEAATSRMGNLARLILNIFAKKTEHTFYLTRLSVTSVPSVVTCYWIED